MKGYILSLSTLCLSLGGCASMSGPDTAELNKLPVVQYGQPVPADGNYVLHFPAGVAIDTPVTFKGNMFEREATADVSVKPVKDIYVHKQWLSYDGEHWMDANKAIDLKVQVVVPGYHRPEPGYVTLEMNAIQ